MESTKRVIDLPAEIPVLPVRNTVVFPNAAVPLIVGRARSVRAIKLAQQRGELLLVITQKDAGKEDPNSQDLHRIGSVCLVSKLTQVEGQSFQLIANGLFRFQVTDFIETDACLMAKGIQLPDLGTENTGRIETLAGEVKQLARTILSLAAIPGADALAKLFQQLNDPAQICDLCCTFLHLSVASKQELLEIPGLERRLTRLIEQMVKEKERLVLQNEIQSKMMERLSKDQRDHLLREQLRTIHEELGDETGNTDDFTKRIEEAGLPAEAKKVAKEELSRLGMVQKSSPEYHVIRTYLEWLVNLPWQKESGQKSEEIQLEEARKILDEDHYGISKVKSRIVEFLAVTKLKKDSKGPILCLLGPPGVGKTSIGKSIARALGRKFIRTSLGGVRDEAEIRGHRRTYIGAMPGRIMQSVKRSEVRDPVMILDEIDKIGADFRGDPASALLELLDPEQNHTFLDHYLDVPFDLSRVFFVTTANVIETIPAALRDRLEVIEMSSYSKNEKLEISKRHLLPKLAEDHGMKPEQVKIPELTLDMVIDGYTREAGVRNLQRELSHLYRAAAVELAGKNPPTTVEITSDKLESILGPKRFYSELVEANTKPGLVTGLAWTAVGGEILNIEATRMAGKGGLILTGQLGNVMKESAQIALSLVRARWGTNIPFRFEKSDLHIHVPSGAIPKDGPSAGAAIFLALWSLVEGKALRPKIAVTGEVTLRGAVMPVGGIKEKVIAAHRAGVKTICLPEQNRGDLREVNPEVRNALEFHFIKDVMDLLPIVGLGQPEIDAPVTQPTPPPEPSMDPVTGQLTLMPN